MLKKLKNNNKGALTIWQRGFLYVVLFCVFTFAIDVCILGLELLTVSHQATYVAEKLSFQGGFIGSRASDAAYWNNQDFYDYLNKSLVRFGVDGVNLHWSLYANDKGSTKAIVNTKSGLINLSYVSRNNTNPGAVSGNYGYTSSITISFEHKYFFSGQIFKFNSATNTYKITKKYQNLYING